MNSSNIFEMSLKSKNLGSIYFIYLFSHLLNGDNDSYFIGLGCRLNEILGGNTWDST